MSTTPETDLDLEKLFLPAWAQESATTNRYAGFSGGEERRERSRDDRPGRRPPGRDRGPGRDKGRPDDRRGAPRQVGAGRRPDQRREERRERPEPPPPPLEINVTLLPDENGVDSISRQIKTTGRAYPLFGIAQLILQKPERYGVRLSVKKKPDGQPVQPLFICALDDSLWLSEDEAVAHVLRNHFATFYQAEKTATEPPKGTYTFVAQCGMSGVILGPPNHHDYQNQLRKLHAERFARMPFDAFKARVKIVRDEAVVKKWVEDQSWKTEFVCLNVPEPLKLPNMEEVEKHFRSVHKENIIKSTESHTLSGVAARSIRSQGLARLVRQVCEDQKRFPLQIATLLSQQFASRGLQFFKVNRTVTHVSVARPHFLDLETTPVSDGIKKIVEFINARPKSTRRKLMDALAPVPAQPISVPAEGTPPAEPAAPTAEQTAVISDLHWLIHQGHVIEFASGILEMAKKPVVRPPKPANKPDATASPAAGTAVEQEVTSAAEPAVVEEVATAEIEPIEEQTPPPAQEPAIQPQTDVVAAPPEAQV